MQCVSTSSGRYKQAFVAWRMDGLRPSQATQTSSGCVHAQTSRGLLCCGWPCERLFAGDSGAPAASRRDVAGNESVVAVDPLHAFVALLRLDRQRGDRPRLEPAQADRLAGLLAIAIGAVLDPLDRLVDLGDQLARAVPGAKFQRPVGLDAGPVGQVGLGDPAGGKAGEGIPRLAQQALAPA